MKQFLVILISGLAILSACKKGPGEGGRAALSGKVMQIEKNASDVPVDSFYVAEQRVYLIYGDDATFSQEVRTNYDGTYVFNYLLPGNYTVFAYSECKTCASGVESRLINAEINGRKQEKELEDLKIVNY